MMAGQPISRMDIDGFPPRVRRLRLEAGYKRQQDLADALGVTNETISHYERGHRTPSFGMLCQLAGLLRVSERYLAFGDDEQTSDKLHDLKLAIRRAILARKPMSDIMRMVSDA